MSKTAESEEEASNRGSVMLKRLFSLTISRTLQIAFYAGAAVGTLIGTCAGAAIGYGFFRLSHNCESDSMELQDSELNEEEFVGSKLPEEDSELSDEEFVGAMLKSKSELAGENSFQQQGLTMSEEDFVGPPLPENANEPINEDEFVGPRLNDTARNFPSP
jgi:hypothetical protein